MRWLIVASIVMLALGIAFAFAAREPKLAGTAETLPIPDTVINYEWKNNEAAVLAEIVVFNGRRIPPRIYLAELERRTRQTRQIDTDRLLHMSNKMSISPDGRRFVYDDESGAGYRTSVVEFAHGWSKSVGKSIRYQCVSNIVWIHDSSHWIYLARGWDLPSQHGLRLVHGSVGAASPSVGTSLGFLPGTESWDMVGVRLLGKLDEDHAIAWPTLGQDSPDMNGSLTLLTVSLDPRPATREYAIRLQNNGVARDVALSRSGKRLAWISHENKHVSKFSAIIGKWIPSYRPNSVRFALHTSRIDGTGQRIVGWFPETAALKEPVQTLLKWLPDDKHVSFVFRDKLWVVPCRP